MGLKAVLASLIIIALSSSVLARDKFKVEYDKDQRFENPYPIKIKFNNNLVGVVIKDFFSNKKKEGVENKFVIINRSNLKSEVVDFEKFSLSFPISKGELSLTFKNLFEKPIEKIENTGEVFKVSSVNCKNEECDAYNFTIGSTNLKVLSDHSLSYNQLITHAFKNNNELWIAGLENMAVNEEGIIGRGGFGIYSIDLDKKAFQPTTDEKIFYDDSWISLISEDQSDKNLVWIGNNLGLYAVNRLFKEQIACVQVLDKVGNFKSLKCFKNVKNMSKYDQAEELLK